MSTAVNDLTVSTAFAGDIPVLHAALLTGGFDRPYAFGLAMSLVVSGVYVEVIGTDEIDSPEMHATPGLRFVNLSGKRKLQGTFLNKLLAIAEYYASLLRYAAKTKAKVFHILWNSKLQLCDRTLLMLYYKALGKRLVLTAHNINQGQRDANDSLLNRLTLRAQYRLTDHIFVHTPRMKEQLVSEFGVKPEAVTVLRHPVNDVFPSTDLTCAKAKRLLSIGEEEKTILFLGRITPYKGLEYLIAAFGQLVATGKKYRLIIAGQPKKGSENYMDEIRRAANDESICHRIIQKMQFIPDEDIELYLKAADVLALPYKSIFQSGVLFLGYTFGLPAVATEVGSFREEIIEGKTGFVCPPGDAGALAQAIERYFDSDIYLNLSSRRQEIKEYAHANYSWAAVAGLTRTAYAQLSMEKSA